MSKQIDEFFLLRNSYLEAASKFPNFGTSQLLNQDEESLRQLLEKHLETASVLDAVLAKLTPEEAEVLRANLK